MFGLGFFFGKPAFCQVFLEQTFLSRCQPCQPQGGKIPESDFARQSHAAFKIIPPGGKGWVFYSLLTLTAFPWASSSSIFSPNEPGNLWESPAAGDLRESVSTTGFGVPLSQDLGCCCPRIWGVSVPAGELNSRWGAASRAHPTAPSLCPPWPGSSRWHCCSCRWRGILPGVFQAAPITAVASKPKLQAGINPFPCFRLLDAGIWPADPSPLFLGRRLSRCPPFQEKWKQETKELSYAASSPARCQRSIRRLSERANPDCSQGKPAKARAGAQSGSSSSAFGRSRRLGEVRSWDRVTKRG